MSFQNKLFSIQNHLLICRGRPACPPAEMQENKPAMFWIFKKRKSARLSGYDYAQEGAYFITIVVQGRFPLFGEISQGSLVLNDSGVMIGKWWEKIGQKFSNIQNDAFVVMPNHFHGILFLKKQDLEKFLSDVDKDLQHLFSAINKASVPCKNS